MKIMIVCKSGNVYEEDREYFTFIEENGFFKVHDSEKVSSTMYPKLCFYQKGDLLFSVKIDEIESIDYRD